MRHSQNAGFESATPLRSLLGVSAIVLASGSFITFQVLPCEILSSFAENLTFGSEVQSFNHTLHLMEKQNRIVCAKMSFKKLSYLDSIPDP
jgi:hypothetical protein